MVIVDVFCSMTKETATESSGSFRASAREQLTDIMMGGRNMRITSSVERKKLHLTAHAFVEEFTVFYPNGVQPQS